MRITILIEHSMKWLITYSCSLLSIHRYRIVYLISFLWLFFSIKLTWLKHFWPFWPFLFILMKYDKSCLSYFRRGKKQRLKLTSIQRFKNRRCPVVCIKLSNKWYRIQHNKMTRIYIMTFWLQKHYKISDKKKILSFHTYFIPATDQFPLFPQRTTIQKFIFYDRFYACCQYLRYVISYCCLVISYKK